MALDVFRIVNLTRHTFFNLQNNFSNFLAIKVILNMFEKSVQRSIEKRNECSVAAILLSRLFEATKQIRIYVTHPMLLLSIKRGCELLARKLFTDGVHKTASWRDQGRKVELICSQIIKIYLIRLRTLSWVALFRSQAKIEWARGWRKINESIPS